MITQFQSQRPTFAYRLLSALIAFTFAFSVITPPTPVFAQLFPQGLANLPLPGTMVPVSPGFTPPLVTGITVHPENPLEFDFIIGTGDDRLEGAAFEDESTRLIKYFLAALTVPEEEMWVNLSPYEKDRVIPEGFGDTEMGRDLLAQDYLLKQLTASLMYPEDELGQKFWTKVRAKAYEKFGTTEIPMNTFNKIWIVPEEALVYEHGQSAFVVKSHLKVMLEEDYIALQENISAKAFGLDSLVQDDAEIVSGVSSEVVREVLIPEIEKEVNEGETFANLRQVYNSVILATWYKQNLKDSLLGQVYVGKNKTAGVDTDDKQANQKIYEQYVEAFKKGVYNYIREDYDPATQEIIPRKYFSGGMDVTTVASADVTRTIKSSSPLSGSDLTDVTRYVSSPVETKKLNINLVEVAEGADAGQVADIAKPAQASSPIELGNSVLDQAGIEKMTAEKRKRFNISDDVIGVSIYEGERILNDSGDDVTISYETAGWRDEFDQYFTLGNVGRHAAGGAEEVLTRVKKGTYTPKSKGGRLKALVTYDAREGGYDAAMESAQVLAAYEDIDVQIASIPTHTPASIALTRELHGSYDFIINITASHSPIGRMGIKWAIQGVINPASWTKAFDMARSNQMLGYVKDTKKQIESVDIRPELIERYQRVLPGTGDSVAKYKTTYPGVQLVLDAMHGGVVKFKSLFEEWGLNPIRTTPMSEGTYPKTAKDTQGYQVDWAPDPTKMQNLDPSALKEFKDNAPDGSLYLAVDGDGDRLVIWYKHKGIAVELQPNDFAPMIAWYLDRSGMAPKAASRIYRSMVSSRKADVVAEKLGWELEDGPVGSRFFEPYLKDTSNTKAAVAFEESGHIGITVEDQKGVVEAFYDDTIFEVGLILKMITENNQTLGEVVEQFEEWLNFDAVSNRRNPKVDRPAIIAKLKDITTFKQSILTELKNIGIAEEPVKWVVVVAEEGKEDRLVNLDQLGSLPMKITEGVGLEFADKRWTHLRLSGTGPSGRNYAEAPTMEKVSRMQVAMHRAGGIPITFQVGFDIDNPVASSPVDHQDVASGIIAFRNSELDDQFIVLTLRDKLNLLHELNDNEELLKSYRSDIHSYVYVYILVEKIFDKLNIQSEHLLYFLIDNLLHQDLDISKIVDNYTGPFSKGNFPSDLTNIKKKLDEISHPISPSIIEITEEGLKKMENVTPVDIFISQEDGRQWKVFDLLLRGSVFKDGQLMGLFAQAASDKPVYYTTSIKEEDLPDGPYMIVLVEKFLKIEENSTPDTAWYDEGRIDPKVELISGDAASSPVEVTDVENDYTRAEEQATEKRLQPIYEALDELLGTDSAKHSFVSQYGSISDQPLPVVEYKGRPYRSSEKAIAISRTKDRSRYTVIGTPIDKGPIQVTLVTTIPQSEANKYIVKRPKDGVIPRGKKVLSEILETKFQEDGDDITFRPTKESKKITGKSRIEINSDLMKIVPSSDGNSAILKMIMFFDEGTESEGRKVTDAGKYPLITDSLQEASRNFQAIVDVTDEFKIGLNAAGTIGKPYLWSRLRYHNLGGGRVVAVNGVATKEELRDYILNTDSVHGQFLNEGEYVTLGPEKDDLNYDGEWVEVHLKGKKPQKIYGFNIRIDDLTELKEGEKAWPWEDYGVQMVVDTAGVYKSAESAEYHRASMGFGPEDKSGGYVVYSYPSKKDDYGSTIVPGVLMGAGQNIPAGMATTCWSCSTNGNFQIQRGMRTIADVKASYVGIAHSLTRSASKKMMDSRIGLGVYENMIPGSTGLSIAIIPALEESGISVDPKTLEADSTRLPVPDGSMGGNYFLIDSIGKDGEKVTVEKINEYFRQQAQGGLANILEVAETKPSSRQILGQKETTTLMEDRTEVIDLGNGYSLARVEGWFDNVWGYTQRLNDLTQKVWAVKQLEKQGITQDQRDTKAYKEKTNEIGLRNITSGLLEDWQLEEYINGDFSTEVKKAAAEALEARASSPVSAKKALAEIIKADRALFELKPFTLALKYALSNVKESAENDDIAPSLSAALTVARQAKKVVAVGEVASLEIARNNLETTRIHYKDVRAGVYLQVLPIIEQAITEADKVLKEASSSPVSIELQKHVVFENGEKMLLDSAVKTLNSIKRRLSQADINNDFRIDSDFALGGSIDIIMSAAAEEGFNILYHNDDYWVVAGYQIEKFKKWINDQLKDIQRKDSLLPRAASSPVTYEEALTKSRQAMNDFSRTGELDLDPNLAQMVMEERMKNDEATVPFPAALVIAENAISYDEATRKMAQEILEEAKEFYSDPHNEILEMNRELTATERGLEKLKTALSKTSSSPVYDKDQLIRNVKARNRASIIESETEAITKLVTGYKKALKSPVLSEGYHTRIIFEKLQSLGKTEIYKHAQYFQGILEVWRQIRHHDVLPSNDDLKAAIDAVSNPNTASSPVGKKVGGINLNPELLDLQIKRDGNGIPLPLNLQPVRQMHIDGFVPVIINVTPVVNLPLLLGFADGNVPVRSADNNSDTSTFDLSFADKYRGKYYLDMDHQNDDLDV